MAPAVNGQWAEWIQEAADHAAGNGSRSADTFRRAAKAIRLHPEELLHPNQALSIKGIGQAIIGILSSRLHQHCQDEGLPFPDEPLSQKKTVKRKRNSSNPGPSRPRKTRFPELTAEERALDESPNSDGDPARTTGISVIQQVKVTRKKTVRQRKNDLTPSELALDQSDSAPDPIPLVSKSKATAASSQPNKKPARKTQTYIPNRRTGCWGMLVGLYILTVDRPGSFSKQEIIARAQEYCDSSYLETGSREGGAGNSGHYTAWNMKKLLSEGLTASAPGRPPKFKLTKSGFEVAAILAEKENCDLKEFDKSVLPDGMFEIEANNKEGETDERSGERLPNSQAVQITTTINISDNNDLHHARNNGNTRDGGKQPSFETPIINHRANAVTNSLELEEVIRLNPTAKKTVLPDRGPFEFWYLDRNGSRVKKLDDADSRMHPSTFETLYQVEYQKLQSSHPVKRSSIADEPTLEPTLKFNSLEGWIMMGWMYESKAIPNCPGFSLPSTNLASSSHDRSLNTPPSLDPTPNHHLLKPPSSSLFNTTLSCGSTSSDRTINIIDDDSNGTLNEVLENLPSQNFTSVVPGRLLRPTVSGAGSLTPVGSFTSILSEDEGLLEYSQPPVHRTQSIDRLNFSRSPVDFTTEMNGLGSETAKGSSGSESTRSTNIPRDQAATTSLPTPPSPTYVSEQSPDHLFEQSFQQPARSIMPDPRPETLEPMPTSGSVGRTNLQRVPSNLSEISSSHARRRTEEEGRKSVESLPTSRTRVNLRRTASNLSARSMSVSMGAGGSSAAEPEVWKAGTYEICLILDHREVRSLADREAMFNMCQSIAHGLSANKAEPPIHVLQRSLVLGDALWIAVNPADHREVVLDSIVERKRLDDLCASIRDNRFSEQKSRLRRSGLRDPIYIVEAYNTHSNLETNGQMIYTSKSEVMLLNDFQLEATSDWKASVEFLMRRTEVLRELHKRIDLTLIPEQETDPTSHLQRLTALRAEAPGRYWVTTYGHFEHLNNKTATLTVTELWARMVWSVPGMSAEKVADFVERWPTPVDFWRDVRLHYDRPTPLEPAKKSDHPPSSWIDLKAASPLPLALLDDGALQSPPSGPLSIGPTLSKRIWELYTLSQYSSLA